MNIQILPHWCKKIGIILFLLCSFIGGGIDSFMEGAESGFYEGSHLVFEEQEKNENKIETIRSKEDSTFANQREMCIISETFGRVLRTLAFVFLLITLLSKEKKEDEFVSLLRLQTFHITTIICLVLCLLLSAFRIDGRIYIEDIAFVYVLLYLIIFRVKKDRLDLIQ